MTLIHATTFYALIQNLYKNTKKIKQDCLYCKNRLGQYDFFNSFDLKAILASNDFGDVRNKWTAHGKIIADVRNLETTLKNKNNIIEQRLKTSITSKMASPAACLYNLPFLYQVIILEVLKPCGTAHMKKDLF